MTQRDIISVLVERIASESIAAQVGMDGIRRSSGVTDARLNRVWQPDPKHPGTWRVEATYAAVRPSVPVCSCEYLSGFGVDHAGCALHGEWEHQ